MFFHFNGQNMWNLAHIFLQALFIIIFTIIRAISQNQITTQNKSPWGIVHSMIWAYVKKSYFCKNNLNYGFLDV